MRKITRRCCLELRQGASSHGNTERTQSRARFRPSSSAYCKRSRDSERPAREDRKASRNRRSHYEARDGAECSDDKDWRVAVAASMTSNSQVVQQSDPAANRDFAALT